MTEKLSSSKARSARFTELRQRAKAGDAEAAAIIAKQDAAVLASKAKALANGKNYNANRKRRLREEARENKRKGEAGDAVAQAAYEKYSAQKRAEGIRKRRRQGMKPIAEHLAAVRVPEEVKKAKKRAYAKKWTDENRESIREKSRQITALAKSGDPVALAACERRRAQNRAACARFRARARAARA